MPTIPVPQDPFRSDVEAMAQEKDDAVKELKRLSQLGLSLRYPVFFVPGWTDERCATWTTPNTPHQQTAKLWVERIFENAKEHCVYMNFEDETAICESFCDFGNVVRIKIGDRTPCDCVGHSMGGLDIAAGIGMCHPPLRNVRNFVTFGSPLRGTEWGDLATFFGKMHLRKLKPYQEIQARNMDPDHPLVKQLQTPAVLGRVLDNTQHISCFYGSRDLFIQRAGRIDPADIDPAWKKAPSEVFEEQVRNIVYAGAEHTGPAGITQDPRAVLNLVRILAGVPLPKPTYNHGFVVHNT